MSRSISCAQQLTVEIFVSSEHPSAVGAQEREVGLVVRLEVEEGVGEVGGKNLERCNNYISVGFQ